MKKIYLILIFEAMIQFAPAQHSISVGVGFPATQTLIGNLLGLNTSTLGPFTVAYHYETPLPLSFGADLTYAQSTTYLEKSSISLNYISLMGNANYLFVAREKLKLYTGISIGAAYKYNNYCTNFFPALHLRLFGFRYLFSNIGIQAELGYGVNGILNVGGVYEF